MQKNIYIICLIFLLAFSVIAQEGQSLSDRLSEDPMESADPAPTEGQSVSLPEIVQWQSGSFGPQQYDGNNIISLVANGSISTESVVVYADGRRLGNDEYIVAPNSSGAILRIMRSLPVGTVIEANFRFMPSGAQAPTDLMSNLAGGFSIDPSGTNPFKIYYGQQNSMRSVSLGNSLFSDYRVQVPTYGSREEFGFSVNNFAMGDASFTYGSVANTERRDSSYRNEFIRNNILSNGSTYIHDEDQEKSDDISWNQIRYGDPSASPVWYVSSSASVDEGYSPVASSGASQDLQAFLSQGDNWGGRSLMSPWWNNTQYASIWQQIEGKKGREKLSQFTGLNVGYQGYGFNMMGGNIVYRSDRFSQEDTGVGRTITDDSELVDINWQDTGTRFTHSTSGFTMETRPELSSEAGNDGSPGTSTTRIVESTSLAQRIGDNSSASWGERVSHVMDNISGIEGPSRYVRNLGITNIGLASTSLSYSLQETGSEDWDADSIYRHRWLMSDVGLGELDVDFGLSYQEKDGGLSDTDFSISSKPTTLFEGFSVNGFQYRSRFDEDGSRYLSRDLSVSWQEDDFAINASWNNSNIGYGFTDASGRSLNPSSTDMELSNYNVNMRLMTISDLDLRAGWDQRSVNGDASETYYIAGSYQKNVLSGSLLLQASQYRNYDRLGVLRPSYDWMARYSMDNFEVGIREFRQYGTLSENNIVSQSYWGKWDNGHLNAGLIVRTNPIVRTDPRSSPQSLNATSSEYFIGYNTELAGGNLSARLSLASNAYPASWNYATEWPSPLFAGNLAGNGAIYTLPQQNDNWQSGMSLRYQNDKITFDASRQMTRYTFSALRSQEVRLGLGWQISPRSNLSLQYRSWKTTSPRYGEDASGDMDGESYTFKYRYQGSNGGFSLGMLNLGPLEGHLGQRTPYGQEALEMYQGAGAFMNQNTRWFATYTRIF